MYVRSFHALDENEKSRTLAMYVPTLDIKSGNLGGILKRSGISWLGELFSFSTTHYTVFYDDSVGFEPSWITI